MADFERWSHANLVRLVTELNEENKHLRTDLKHALQAYRMEIKRNGKPESQTLPMLQPGQGVR